MKSNDKKIISTIKGCDKNFRIINYLVQYNNYYGGVFVNNEKDGIIFSVYSLQLYNTEFSCEDINVSLYGEREENEDIVTYNFYYYDNQIPDIAQYGDIEFFNSYKVKYTFDEIDIDLFIKEAVRIIKSKRQWVGKFLVTQLQDEEIKEFYLSELNKDENLNIYQMINHFYGNKQIFNCRFNNDTSLDLTNCGLEKLPDCIKRINQVESLTIANNYLQDGIGEILQLKNLKKIELFSNMISELPERISSLKYLEELIIEEKFIYSIPDEVGELKNLKKLTIKNTGINKIPDSICNLINLEELMIIGNSKLEKIPDCIVRLQNLTHLYLYNNNINLLPDEIGELENLKMLHLSRNKLFCLPKTISMLSKLEKIDVSYNKLELLENDIFEIECLRELNIKGNLNIDIDELHTIILSKKLNEKINIII